MNRHDYVERIVGCFVILGTPIMLSVVSIYYFIENPYNMVWPLALAVLCYENGYKLFYKKGSTVLFWAFSLVPTVFVWLFIAIRWIMIWVAS